MKRKSFERIIKLAPVILNIYIVIVVGYAINDIAMSGSEFLLGHALFLDVILFISSKYFKFCSWHRILIVNLMFYATLQYIDARYKIIDNAIVFISIVSGAWSVTSVAATILYFKYDWRKRCTKTVKAA